MRGANAQERAFWIGIAVVAGSIVIALLYLLGPEVWSNWPRQAYIDNYFCEYTDMHRPVRQPFNTWSNLGYMVAAGYIFADWRGRPGLKAFWPRVYAAACATVFLGSVFFHASLSLPAERMDLSGVYAVSLVPLCWALTQGGRAKGSDYVLVLAVVVWMLMTGFAFRMLNHIVVPGMIFSLVGLTTWHEWRLPAPKAWKWGMLAAMCIGLGMMCFSFDMRRVACDPNGLPPHSVWHLLAAGSSVSFYMYAVRRGEVLG